MSCCVSVGVGDDVVAVLHLGAAPGAGVPEGVEGVFESGGGGPNRTMISRGGGESRLGRLGSPRLAPANQQNAQAAYPVPSSLVTRGRRSEACAKLRGGCLHREEALGTS